ncbi:lipoprotein [Streptomyces sp. NPDC002088]|uniref:lipoprotein n=1 Tax=Streptomyces sp. NPDC002088 TaxID=3154665 RepID=UPI00332DA917
MRRTLLTLLLAAALTGCSLLGQDTPCTKADEDSRVSAVWRPADFGGRDAARIRLCVDGTCKERSSGSPDDPFASLSVQLPDGVGASTLPVRLTVTSAQSGDTVVEDSTRARLTEQHPNGTSCPPTVWTATFRAHPNKGLTSPKGMKLQG